LDYSTWFQDWACALTEALPFDEYVFVDGILGDIFLRGLYITPSLHDCVARNDKERATELLHAQYVRGFNAYTRGLERWRSVLEPDLLEGFSAALWDQVHQEIHGIAEDDFVTMFLIRNRTRRAISPLPLHLFGRRGSVVLPFCDVEFLRKALSIPLALRRNGAMYQALLERGKPGLSTIASTNTTNLGELEPYLIGSISELSSKSGPGQTTDSRSENGDVTDTAARDALWAQEVIENPPSFFMNSLTPELRSLIRRGKKEELEPFRFFLERIFILESYFS
jgi:hypothetical protein